MDWTSVIERDLRRLSELSKGDITRILAFLHHDACDGKLYRLVRSSFPFNLSSGPPNWGLCRPNEIPSTISLSLSFVYRNAVDAANAKPPIKWTEEHVELYLEATIVSCWSSLSEESDSDPDLGELEIGTDLLNEISLQVVGQKDSRMWGLWAVLDFLNHSRKHSDTTVAAGVVYNAAREAMKRIEQGRSFGAEPEALLTAVTTQFASIMQKSKSGGSLKSPKEVGLDHISQTQNQSIGGCSSGGSQNSSTGVDVTSAIDEPVSSSLVKPVESHRAAIRYVPSKRLGGRAHVFSLTSTTSSTMASTPAVTKVNDSTQYGSYSSQIAGAQMNNGSSGDIYGVLTCDPKTPIPIRRQKFDDHQVKFAENPAKNVRDTVNDGQGVVTNKQRENGRRIGFNIDEIGMQGPKGGGARGDVEGGTSNGGLRNQTRTSEENQGVAGYELEENTPGVKETVVQNPSVCKYSLEPAVKYPGYKLEVNGKYYEIISSIQKGGSSQVYKVKESKTGEMYALKCVRVFTKNHDHSIKVGGQPEEKGREKVSLTSSANRSRKSIRKSTSADRRNGGSFEGEEEDENDEDEDEEQQLLLMFTEEVNLLKRLKGCPHVIQLIDSEIALSCGAIDIIMELGVKDLNGILQGNTPLPSIGMLRSIWTEMVLALKNVHDLRIVHGDIKPANFVFVEQREATHPAGFGIGGAPHTDEIENINDNTTGAASPGLPGESNPRPSSVGGSSESLERSKLLNKTVKIIDFGISRPIADDTTHIFRDKAVGSLPFMAPETVRPVSLPESKFAAVAVASKLRMPHQVMSRTADIWSLGAILYRITYKRHLFQQPASSGGPGPNNGTNKKGGSSGKSNIAPHEILMFLQNDQSKISFPREMGIVFSEQSEEDGLWFDALRNLLKWTLQWDPANRPNVNQLLTHPFIDSGIISRYIMFKIPKNLSSEYFIPSPRENSNGSQTEEERASLLESLFKSTAPLGDVLSSKPRSLYLASMRWNVVCNGNFLFHSIYKALKSNLNSEQGSDQSAMINNLAISQYLSLVKEVSIPSPPSVNSMSTTSRKNDRLL
ncbi:TTK protein kinase [Cryptosporidium felis]|nr:TTK protein kinase [Cryptosporidium felis]